MKKKDNIHIQTIKKILRLVFGENYEQNRRVIKDLIALFKCQNEKEDGGIDYNKIDKKDFILYVHYWYNKFSKERFNKKENE